MMATGMKKGGSWKFTRRTEIVDVATGVTCSSDLADFPVGILGAVGSNINGIPVVCGGFEIISGAYWFSEKCYRFTNGGWEEFARMTSRRDSAAGVMYNNKLHVFGGSGCLRPCCPYRKMFIKKKFHKERCS